MPPFKLLFPGGYTVKDINDDNLDVHVILPNEMVYFAVLYTLNNISYLMSKEDIFYFWDIDMILIKDLKQSTIHNAVSELIERNAFQSAFCELGSIHKIYGDDRYANYADIPYGKLDLI